MTYKSLIALTALALTMPVMAHAEEVVTQTTITKVSKSNPEIAKAASQYQASESQKAAASLQAHVNAGGAVPPGYKVTTVKTGDIVTKSYRMPSAPVAGDNSFEVKNEVFVPATKEDAKKEQVIEWYNNQPITPNRVAPSSGAAQSGSRLIKGYNN